MEDLTEILHVSQSILPEGIKLVLQVGIFRNKQVFDQWKS